MPRYVSTILGLAICSGFALPAGSQAAPDGASVWVEGESAAVKRVQAHPWYSNAVRKEQMSGEAWLSHWSDADDGTARYDLKIEKDGDYTLWVRANPVGSALSYQVNGGAWAALDTSKASDLINMAQDDKADLRFLGWMNGGKIPLQKGPATLGLKMHSPGNHHGAVDCFVLTTRAFEPRGTLKPGETQPPPLVPVLNDGTLRKWIDFIRPSADDTKWERLGWREELGAAVQEARTLQRPLLLWAMNGHPLACT